MAKRAKAKVSPINWPADRIERRAVKDLAPYANNSRTHSDAQIDQIAASIREWGWTTPVLIDDAGTIIAGHARVQAAERLGILEIPVMIAAGWSEAQVRAYVIADNKLAENAGWDEDLLKVEFAALDALGFDMDLTGFGLDEIGALMVDKTAGQTDPDDVPDAPAKPVTRPGDVWLLGAYFECDDCGRKFSFDEGRALEACPCGES